MTTPSRDANSEQVFSVPCAYCGAAQTVTNTQYLSSLKCEACGLTNDVVYRHKTITVSITPELRRTPTFFDDDD